MDKEEKIATVRMITVDERLAEDLIRLEICELINRDDSGEFKLEPEFWKDIAQEGEEIVARPFRPGKKSQKDLYTDLMSIPEEQVREFPWKDLEEGQVFLSGAFSIISSNGKGGFKVGRVVLPHCLQADFIISIQRSILFLR